MLTVNTATIRVLETKLTKDNDDPCDGYSGGIHDNGEPEVADKSHISCTLSSHCPGTIKPVELQQCSI